MSIVPISLVFDMRAPEFGAPPSALYGAAMDMAAFADNIGVNRILLAEHHGSEDGYLPAPFILGGGMAARTKKARITLGAVILPLHDPVKIAEQIAVLDLMSNGRVDVVIGAGYVPSEFAAFGVSRRDRAKLLDEGIDIILRALSGDRFSVNGRPIYVRPLPVQDPHDILLVGGGVEASARRAARFDLGFLPIQPALFSNYDAECAKLGRKPRRKLGGAMPMSIHLSEDPDEAWALIKPHIAHVTGAYAKWAEEEPDASSSPFSAFIGMDDVDPLRDMELFAVWTPERLIAHAKQLDDFSSLNFMPLIGGLAPEVGWKSLELLASTSPKLEFRGREKDNATSSAANGAPQMAFNEQTKMGELLDNPAASAILLKHLPEMANAGPMLSMARGMSLKVVAGFPQANISQEKLQAIVAELQAL